MNGAGGASTTSPTKPTNSSSTQSGGQAEAAEVRLRYIYTPCRHIFRHVFWCAYRRHIIYIITQNLYAASLRSTESSSDKAKHTRARTPLSLTQTPPNQDPGDKGAIVLVMTLTGLPPGHALYPPGLSSPNLTSFSIVRTLLPSDYPLPFLTSSLLLVETYISDLLSRLATSSPPTPTGRRTGSVSTLTPTSAGSGGSAATNQGEEKGREVRGSEGRVLCALPERGTRGKAQKQEGRGVKHSVVCETPSPRLPPRQARGGG